MRQSSRRKKVKMDSLADWLDDDRTTWRRFLKRLWFFQSQDPDSPRWWWTQLMYIVMVISLSGYELAHWWPAVGETLDLFCIFDFGSFLLNF